MKKYYLWGLVGLAILILPLASAQTVNVMQHICDDDVQSRADFEALGSFEEKLLACPTTVLLGDTPTPGAVAAEQTSFNYHVEDRSGVQTISDAVFVQQAICETDLQQDLNNDGEISSETCVDTSLYQYEVDGFTTLLQMAPQDTRFGTLAFTPNHIAVNNDEHTLAYLGREGFGVIQVDPTRDALDNTTTLHVYNFQMHNTNDTAPSTNETTDQRADQANQRAQFLRNNDFTCTDHTTGEACEVLSDDIQGDCRTVAFAEHNSSTTAIQVRACPQNETLEVYRQTYETNHSIEVCMAGICVDELWGSREGPLTQQTTNDNTTNTTPDETNNEMTLQTVNVMQHICTQEVQSRADFEALGSFEEKLLACPTTVLLGDTPTPGAVAAEQTSFNYHVEDRSGVQTISHAVFVQQAICETDLQQDLNNDGEISSDTCVDTSLYSYDVDGFTTLLQMAPQDTRFGTLAFTPNHIAVNNDEHTLAYLGREGFGVIQVDPTRDALDDTTTLHVYNFQN